MWKESCFSGALGFQSIPSGQGVSYKNGSTLFRLQAEGAQTLSIEVDEQVYPLQCEADGYWAGCFSFKPGFHYANVRINGDIVISPWLPLGFGFSRAANFIDVPLENDAFYTLNDLPHGAVTRCYYHSSVAGSIQSALVYEPPQSRELRLPVLYLQHGLGENETGWVYQGLVNRIMDRLIADGKAKPMRIVMGNGMVLRSGQPDLELFPNVLVRDLIPFIENAYPCATGKQNRAVAGLSMGSMHASLASTAHPDLFAYVGLFSGFMRFIWREDQPHLAFFDRPEAHSAFRVYFRAMGDEDPFFSEFEKDDLFLQSRGLRHIRKVYPGRHDWQVWRMCARDFLPLLFQEADS